MPTITLFGYPVIVYRRRRRRVRGNVEYLQRKEEARTLIHARLAYWQSVYPFVFGQVRIKNHRSAWGSCSSKRNLNFNWRLVALPIELVDYVVVHELCHTIHLNHSKEFWNLLEQLQPHYQDLRTRLKNQRIL